ncbi:hypothetical protein B9Q17_00715 [Marinobacter vinifirmus]|jgi:hypothetical protein|uniref:Uncharacterized protein n=1 Tax=Marinobacter vinifirmus TaxID=355591 RepID=A0A7Z1DTD3_9GAMM|nr:hypothetical protein B9Q17_00715 [Marinobacter vinifirmus]
MFGKMSEIIGKISRMMGFLLKNGWIFVFRMLPCAFAFARIVYYQGTKPETPKWHSEQRYRFLDCLAVSWQPTNPIANTGATTKR